MNMHAYTALVTLAALLVYFVMMFRVGQARGRFKISPPAQTGNPDFERILRVQQNTAEQLILFLPALWLCTVFFNDLYSIILGILWIIGRIVYGVGYCNSVPKRMPGFIITLLSSFLLWAGALYGVISYILVVQ